ncbi:MAG: family 78 glycoside hydrolase catalytic domain [Armatimonadetes bacterium]|nr:family 78 glycoside hydrolase catalytic domain [Armatimonadota bacterium]
MALSLVALLTLMAPMRAEHLRTEYLVDPLALQTQRPRFSWELNADGYGAHQTAYRIVVESDGTVLWDSGKVSSNAQGQVEYSGTPLKSRLRCTWKLQVWDGDDKASPWAKAKFETGLNTASDWGGQWITTAEPTPDIHPSNNGYHSEMETSADVPKWVTIDLGSTKRLDGVRLWPCRPFDWQKDEPGFLFPVRFSISVGSTESEMSVAVAQRADLPNPGENPFEMRFPAVEARYVRLDVSRLRDRGDAHFGFALTELEALDGETVVSKGANVTAKDSVENRSWSITKLTDGDRKSHKLTGLDALPVTELKKQAFLDHKVKSARFYATALGAYEASINGKRIGDHILAPEWTDYHSRVQYQAYDVTDLLEPGGNMIHVSLGDGWYAGRIGMAQGLDPRGYPRAVYGRRAWFRGQLEIEFSNGTRAVIPTDGTWQSTTQGTVRSSDIYDGEAVDLSFGNPQWRLVTTSSMPDQGNPEIVAQTNEPIRVVERIKPKAPTQPKTGVLVYDFGQNMVGWVSAKLRGRTGAKVKFQYAEVLNDDGTVYTANLRGAPQVDTVAFPSEGRVNDYEFRPHFTYHGFRYLQITGLESAADIKDLTGEVFCSSSPQNSTFECSDPMVNRLWQNILWTQRANLMSSPTDCPQRDERLGWMGDILAFSQNAFYNMDMSGFFTKWLQDVRDAQADDGRYPDFAPHPYGKNDRFTGVPGWGDAGVVCAWVHYSNTGDARLLADHYDSARRWIDWIASKNPDHLWKNDRHNDYGDWLNGDTLVRDGWDSTGGEVPKDVFATMMWYQSARMVEDMAKVLGKSDEAKRVGMMADQIRNAFRSAYLSPDGGITGDTQAGYALALHFGLVPGETKAASFSKLITALEKRKGLITTGFHSTLPLMEVLTDEGRADLAYKILLNHDFPGWGYSIDNGATTIWERWDGYVKGRGFQDPGMNSFNHWALGSVGQWIMERVAGITTSSGPEHQIEIRPVPGFGVSWAKATYRSRWGMVKSAWTTQGSKTTLELEIPPNTTAQLHLPKGLSIERVEVGEKGLKRGASANEASLVSGSYKIIAQS